MTYTKKELKNYLKELSKKKAEVSSFSFEYESGHREFQARHRIILSGGTIIQWKIPKKTSLDRETEEKEGKKQEIEVSDEKILIFVEGLRKRKIWDLENCFEKSLTDAPLLTFRIKNNDQLVFEQQVWERCRNDCKRTKEVIRALAALLPLDWSPP